MRTSHLIVIVSMLVCVACADESSSNVRQAELVGDPHLSPAPEYYPEDNHVGGGGGGLVQGVDEIRSERTARAARRASVTSADAWRERVIALAPQGATLVLGRFLADLGPLRGKHYHSAQVEVIEQLSPAPTLPSSIEVVQHGTDGAPYTCGGLRWRADQDVALVVSPTEHPGAYLLFMHFGDRETAGWAYQIDPDTFSLANGTPVSRAVLEDLGGAM
jgi:hypothetical protein